MLTYSKNVILFDKKGRNEGVKTFRLFYHGSHDVAIQSVEKLKEDKVRTKGLRSLCLSIFLSISSHLL